MTTPTAASGLAPVNGIELACQVFGEGDPLILLHGGFGSVRATRSSSSSSSGVASATPIGIDQG
jgi:hypothetical protein